MFLFTISGEIPSLMRICCSLFAFLSLSTSECYVTEIRWIYEKFGAAGNWKNLRPCVCLFAVASSAFNSATMRLMLANKRSINKLYVPENAPPHRYTAAHLAMERNLISDPKIDFHGNFWLVFRFRFRDWFGANPLADIKVTCRVSLQFVRYFPLFRLFPAGKSSRTAFRSRTLQTLSYYRVMFDEHIELPPSPSHMSQFNRTWLKKFRNSKKFILWPKWKCSKFSFLAWLF